MTERTKKARAEVLALVQKAQSLLYTAAQTACPLKGWCDQWDWIGEHADATKDLWHRLNNSAPPKGHDGDDREPARNINEELNTKLGEGLV
jgi:hypothetical protein